MKLSALSACTRSSWVSTCASIPRPSTKSNGMGLTVEYPVRIVRLVTGDELVALRKKLKLTQAAFAERLGVPAYTQGRHEGGQVQNPHTGAPLAHCLART